MNTKLLNQTEVKANKVSKPFINPTGYNVDTENEKKK